MPTCNDQQRSGMTTARSVSAPTNTSIWSSISAGESCFISFMGWYRSRIIPANKKAAGHLRLRDFESQHPSQRLTRPRRLGNRTSPSRANGDTSASEVLRAEPFDSLSPGGRMIRAIQATRKP
jgi:hypothetical protein